MLNMIDFPPFLELMSHPYKYNKFKINVNSVNE